MRHRSPQTVLGYAALIAIDTLTATAMIVSELVVVVGASVSARVEEWRA